MILLFSLVVLTVILFSPTENIGEVKTLVTDVKIIQTTGDIIDPINYSGDPLGFDPDSYLRDFNYGRSSQLSDGTTLREFTLIAEDDKEMEISPGIFFNVWTYNGTAPGPTIRVTEGDLVRVNFINNGENLILFIFMERIKLKWMVSLKLQVLQVFSCITVMLPTLKNIFLVDCMR